MTQKSLKFHIKHQDYFGTMATILSLIRQEKEKLEARHNKTFKRLEKKLVYLQNNYQINKNRDATK